MEESTFVIIGGGIAGVSCAEGLAFLAPDHRVVLITSSPLIKAVTNIVPLSQTLMKFDVEERRAVTLTETHPSVSVIQDTVKRVDTEDKVVLTESGRSLRYEKLCICTGANPKLIEDNNPLIIGIRDTESVQNFSSKIKNARRIVVLGNGGIATELVHEIEGVEIVWVVKDKHISATFVDPGAAEFFQHKLNKTEDKSESRILKRMKYSITDGVSAKGGAALGPDWHTSFNIRGSGNLSDKIQVEYCCEIARILKDSSSFPISVELTNGKIIACDFVLSATGVLPNSSIEGLESLARDKDGGFLVDSNLQTSKPGVFAAGDVCSADWDLAEHWFQMRLWTQALQMGRYAAKSMSSDLRGEEFLQDFCFELFTHVTKFFGFKVVLIGLYNGQKLDNSYDIILRMTKGVEYIKLILKDGKMKGAVLIGETNLEEMCENLILNQLDLTIYGEDLLNPDIDVEDYFD